MCARPGELTGDNLADTLAAGQQHHPISQFHAASISIFIPT
jgi:hypothetical protein